MASPYTPGIGRPRERVPLFARLPGGAGAHPAAAVARVPGGLDHAAAARPALDERPAAVRARSSCSTFPELWGGNITILLAAMIVIGFRRPGVWAFAVLTKVTPALGLLWFVVRREWRALVEVGVVTAAIVAVSLLIAPALWREWIELLASSTGSSTVSGSVPIPLAAAAAAGRCRHHLGRPRRPALGAAHRGAARDAGHLVGQLRHPDRVRGAPPRRRRAAPVRSIVGGARGARLTAAGG